MAEMYELHAEVCKIFSNPIRLKILYLLKENGLSVTEIIQKTKLSQANVSQHISIMKAKDILSSERKGKNIYYSLNNQKIIKALNLIQEVLKEKLK